MINRVSTVCISFLLLSTFVLTYAANDVKPGTQQSQSSKPISLTNTEAVLFEDLFNGVNTDSALTARGWVWINNDGGGTTTTFTGNATVFPAYEGPTTGYVGENYNGANGFLIDQWLISPVVNVAAGDTLSFWHRSPDGNPYDDSIYVRVSPTGSTALSSFTYTWGRYLVSEAGWANWIGVFPAAGAVRFAIQYYITDGGPSGNNSNYIGIDLLQVRGTGIIPVELKSFAANVNDANVTLNWATASETNNKGFEVERKSVGSSFVQVGFISGKGTTTEAQSYSFADKNLQPGKYIYRLKQIDFDGSSEYSNNVEVEVIAPAVFELKQNYPNPFNPSTEIKFSLAVDSKVSMKVFNIVGEEVAELINSQLAAGSHNINFNASSLNSGVYFYRINAAGIDGSNFSSVKKMILTK
jgi:hypothetical protein